MGCSTVKKAVQSTQQLELSSEPVGADVISVSGEKLGVTPLILDGESLKKILKNGKVNLVLSAPGYQQRELLLDLHGKDSHTVQLERFGDNYFSERLIQDFSKEANAMARSLAEIQSLVFVRKLSEAEQALTNFQKRFPNIAASYVLFGSVESLRGNQTKAKGYLLRARTLDPSDPVAARMLARQLPADPKELLKPQPVRQPATAPIKKGGTR